MWRSLPNFLSITRIVLGVITVALYSNRDKIQFAMSLCIITLALVSDFADGYLARKLGVTSAIGYVLDGLGDRAMYVALLLVFVRESGIALMPVLLLVFREISIYAIRTITEDWYISIARLRLFSRLQAGGIRLWFLTFFLADGARLYGLALEPYAAYYLVVIQGLLLWVTIIVGYFPVYAQVKSIMLQGSELGRTKAAS